MKFKHKINILQNKANSEIAPEKWNKISETYADISPLCDSRFISLESMEFGNVISEEYYVFHIRFMDNIQSTMRIEHDKKIFEIKRIINKGFNNRITSIIALRI